jgi:radical SAM protein with 4Fe4S-binding SPASM domain
MTATLSKTFCILPWIHIYANPDGSVLPCSVGDHHIHLGNIQSQSINEVWNGEEYRTMRKNMLAGEKCAECSACYKIEESGVTSPRQSHTDKFKKYISLADTTNSDGSVEMNLRYFDVRWSNICNFKCRSCSSTYSSSWATEDNSTGQNKKVFIFAGGDNNDALYNQFLPYFKNIEEFYFAGGEPLLTDKHYDILEYLISIGKTDVKLHYNTNLSNLKYKDKSVILLWKHFSNVQVYASLDSWGNRAEYIREGTNWNIIEDNVRLIKQQIPHVQLYTTTVVSSFNVSTLPEFFTYIIESKLFNINNLNPSLYSLQTPEFYSFSILNDKLKSNIIDKLSSATFNRAVNTQIQNVILSLKKSKYDEQLLQEFRKITLEYDTLRNRNFLETFPELDSVFNPG